MRLLDPEFATLNGAALLISLRAFVAHLRFEWGLLKTLGSVPLVEGLSGLPRRLREVYDYVRNVETSSNRMGSKHDYE